MSLPIPASMILSTNFILKVSRRQALGRRGGDSSLRSSSQFLYIISCTSRTPTSNRLNNQTDDIRNYKRNLEPFCRDQTLLRCDDSDD